MTINKGTEVVFAKTIGKGTEVVFAKQLPTSKKLPSKTSSVPL
jgi:hypothetical protein